jgi:membrane protease YdiL (CAAX protease family)
VSNQDANKRITLYLVITFALSSVCYVLINRAGGLEFAPGYVVLLMWSPAIAGLTTTFVFQRNLRGLGWGFGKPHFYLIAYFLPIVYAGLVYATVWLLGLGRLDTASLGGNPAVSLLANLTVGVLGSALSAAGEEIGWRGVLVPQLARQNTFLRIGLISGFIWGIWHIPLVIAGGYTSGAPTWYAAVCFMVLVMGVSFALAWLRLESGSIWPAVLLHATHNLWIQGILDKVTVNTGSTEYFTTEFGLGLAIMGIVVGVAFWRIGLGKREALKRADPMPAA